MTVGRVHFIDTRRCNEMLVGITDACYTAGVTPIHMLNGQLAIRQAEAKCLVKEPYRLYSATSSDERKNTRFVFDRYARQKWQHLPTPGTDTARAGSIVASAAEILG